MPANYLRIRKTAEIKAGLKHERKMKRQCPYCKSKFLQVSNTDTLCLNCQRHFKE